MKKKIAIIGTVGIPAKYGGFETLVEYLTRKIGDKVNFTVYCSSKAYKNKLSTHNGAKLEYVNIDANGIQSIIYDIISLFKAARKSNVILILGVSGTIILPVFRMFYANKKLIINIDGLEHKRQKWGTWTKRFLKLSERIAIKYGDEIIADNKGIHDYVMSEYGLDCNLIAYGADHVKNINLSLEVADKFKVPSRYAFKVCRIEPENNIQIILDAFKNLNFPLVVIGNWNKSEYGRALYKEYSVFDNLHLLEPIYDQVILNQIRSNCTIYVHGHSAGGTNPSLVEAMALGLPIVAFDVNYNRETTFNQALYFSSIDSLRLIIDKLDNVTIREIGENMLKLAKENYTWELISQKYNRLF